MNTRHHIKRGLFWLGSANVVMRGLELGSLIVLLWLLTEEQMGLAALSWTVAVILEAYNGLGVGVALVQTPSLERRQLDSTFWFVTVVAGALLVGVSVCSPLIGRFFGEPELAPMVVVASSKLLWTGVAMVPLQLLHRELRFREVAFIETASIGLAAVTKIVLAAFGAGAWALVIGHAAEGFFLLCGVYLVAPFWPHFRFAFGEIRGLVSFGLKVATSKFIYHGYRNLDYVVIGKAFGTAAVGVYRVGFEVAMSASMAVLNVVNGAAFPVYSRLAGQKDQLRESFLWTTRGLVVLIGPIAVFLAFAAPNLVPLLGGEKWAGAVPVVEVLCWAALLRCLAHLTPQLLHAGGRPDLAVYDSLITLLMLAVTFAVCIGFLGEPLGFVSIAWGWLVSYPPILIVLWLFARRIIPLPLRDYLRSFWDGLLTMLATALALGLLSLILTDRLPPALRLASQGAVALGAALLYVRLGLGIRLRDALPQSPSGAES